MDDYAIHLLNEYDVPMTDEDAKKEIEDLGYIFKGNIAGLPGYYLVGKTLEKRSLEEHEIETELNDSSRVAWFEKQVGKKRERRALSSQFNDIGYATSWHLNKDNLKPGSIIKAVDINVLPVWNKKLFGNGIRITVVDDGIDFRHPDILESFDADASRDILLDVPDVSPKNEQLDHHGTRCAAEIVGKPNNGICGVGVAFNAKLSGVTIIGDKFPTDSDEATAFKYHYETQDIFSMSWGPSDDGTQIDGPGRLASLALEDGITKGRNNKGIIYVIASGNGLVNQDNCNYDGYVNSKYTIAIGAVDIYGNQPWYAEECSAIHIVLPGGDESNPIYTSDINNKCSTNHFGTSAAAPLASGIVALLLEHRPNLGWRDVQQLMLLSTIKNDPSSTEWSLNGANIHFHPKYGFGLLDTEKLINNADSHILLKDQHEFSFSNKSMLKIPRNPSYLAAEINVNNIVGISTVEHIFIKVSIQHPRRGDLSFDLISPSNTTSRVATIRKNDKSEDGLNWTFMTNRHWKEKPNGKWQLIIKDNYLVDNTAAFGKEEGLRGTGLLKEWELILNGECVGEYCQEPQIIEPEHANWAAFWIFVGIFLLFGISCFIYVKFIKRPQQLKNYSNLDRSISLQNIKVFKDFDAKESPLESPKDYIFKKQQSTTALPRSISTDSLSTREKKHPINDIPISPLSPLQRSGSTGYLKRDNENLYKSTFKSK